MLLSPIATCFVADTDRRPPKDGDVELEVDEKGTDAAVGGTIARKRAQHAEATKGAAHVEVRSARVVRCL